MITRCLAFAGEPFIADCLNPFNRRLNSSKYDRTVDNSIEFNIHSEQPHVREAFELYRDLLADGQTAGANAHVFAAFEERFLENAKHYRPEEVEKAGSWITVLDKEIGARDAKIVELQKRAGSLENGDMRSTMMYAPET